MRRLLTAAAFLLAMLVVVPTASADLPPPPSVSLFDEHRPNIVERAVELLDWKLVRAEVADLLVRAQFDPVSLRLAVTAPIERLQVYWDVGMPPGAPSAQFQAATGFQILF